MGCRGMYGTVCGCMGLCGLLGDVWYSMGCRGLYGVGCAVGDYKGLYVVNGVAWAVWAVWGVGDSIVLFGL